MSSYFHHPGEELIYRGRQGSGTIFFTSVTGSATGAPVPAGYGGALSIVLIVSAALYVITALVMLALPKPAHAA